MAAATGRTPAKRVRMSAEERKHDLLEVASRVFAEAGFRAATTAHIAREAGVTEPVLYQHFRNKRDLYLACVEEQWARMKAIWEEAIASTDDPSMWSIAMAASIFGGHDDIVVQLWPQALSEASTDGEVQQFFSRHMLEIHDYIAGVYRKSQAAGGIRTDCDPDAEAWIFMAIGILRSGDERLGSIVGDTFMAVVDSRRRWLNAE